MTVPGGVVWLGFACGFVGSNAPDGARTCTRSFQWEYVTVVVPFGRDGDFADG